MTHKGNDNFQKEFFIYTQKKTKIYNKLLRLNLGTIIRSMFPEQIYRYTYIIIFLF